MPPKPQASHCVQQIMVSVTRLSSWNSGAQEQRVGWFIVVVWESPVPTVAAWCKVQYTEDVGCSKAFY